MSPIFKFGLKKGSIKLGKDKFMDIYDKEGKFIKRRMLGTEKYFN